jgi:hypothetical protein
MAAKPGRSRSKRPTAAAEHELAARGNAAEQGLRCVGNRFGEGFGRLREQVGAFEELLLNALFEHGHG